MKIKAFALLLILTLLLTGCVTSPPKPDGPLGPGGPGDVPGDSADLGDDGTSFGDPLEDMGAFDGYFEGESSMIKVDWVSGTKGAYLIEGNTLRFTAVSEDTVYSVSGAFTGNIVVDVGDSFKLELELSGLSLISTETNPITVLSGDEVSIQAKKGFKSYIYDKRAAADDSVEGVYSGAIYSEVDLEIAGKGDLTLVSDSNNGIHSKKDLQVKNLSLLVSCKDNALKGNDSVEITGADLTLIATAGDGIKTSNSDISSKGNQRGTVSITDSMVDVFAACDGIDASYDVSIGGESAVNVYTDKYSVYSEEVTAASSDLFYVRFSSKAYCYSVKYTSSSSEDFEWVNAEYHSAVSGMGRNYYYYSFPKKADYDKMQLFVYSSASLQGQESDYDVATEVMTVPTAYDTVALSSRGYSWTNYTTSVQGGGPGGMGGGMQEGNTDKGDHSTKGIKAANQILISGGALNVKSYDDAIHASNDTTLENGQTPLGNVTVSGGSITLYSNDDGIHADGTVTVSGGSIGIINSYEGVEGERVKLLDGFLTVISKDDAINATATSGASIEIGGGQLYIYCKGDGIDSNSRTAYEGIVFSGGKTVIISVSGGNSAIDSEQGYKYTGGFVIAVMQRGGMSGESTKCQNFSSVGKSLSLSLAKEGYLNCQIGDLSATVKLPVDMSATVVLLGSSSATASAASSTDRALDSNGVCWN